MKALVGHFFRGCVIMVPLVGTLYVLYFIFSAIDGVIGFGVPGLGLLLTLVLVTLVGVFAQNVIGERAFKTTERFITRVPLVKLLYTSIRDFVGAFVGEQRSFDAPVLVSLGDELGVKVLGFATARDLKLIGGPADHIAVYLPQAYTFAGNLLLVPAHRVQPIDIDTAAFTAFVVSGGVVTSRTSEPPPGDKELHR